MPGIVGAIEENTLLLDIACALLDDDNTVLDERAALETLGLLTLEIIGSLEEIAALETAAISEETAALEITAELDDCAADVIGAALLPPPPPQAVNARESAMAIAVLAAVIDIFVIFVSCLAVEKYALLCEW